MAASPRIGFWLSEKKIRKLDFAAFAERLLRNTGIQLVPLDLSRELGAQGPFDAIVHKISDLFVRHDAGDAEASAQCQRFYGFLKSREGSRVVVLDPLPSVRLLCDRALQYSLLRLCAFNGDGILTPNFVDLAEGSSVAEMSAKLSGGGVRFPLLLKPLLAHAHEMSVLMSADQLSGVTLPAVAQTFVPHNACLFKVFVLGDRHFTILRPSLRNLTKEDVGPIHFDSHQLSKDGCTHDLSVQSDTDPAVAWPSSEEVEAAIRSLRQCTGLSLYGIDLIVHADTRKAYAIDVNSFPSYDGVENLHAELEAYLVSAVGRRRSDAGTMTMDLPVGSPPPACVSPPLGYESDTEFRTKDARSRCRDLVPLDGLLSVPTVHLRSLSDVSEYDQRVKAAAAAAAAAGVEGKDSGVGSCSESDTSDCERKMAQLALARQASTHRHHFAVDGVRGNALDFTPSWPRIKRFYGIPKPLPPPAAADEPTTATKSRADSTP